MTAEQPNSTDEWVPFLIEMADIARILRVTVPTISRMLSDGRWPSDEMPPLRMTERVIRFKRPEVEAYFGAPLSDLAPWLIAKKEPA